MSVCHKQWAVVCLLLVISILPSQTIAQGEHSRRAAAEVRVALGDVRRLQTEALAPEHEKGLRDRIAGVLSGLDILLRLADQEMQRADRIPRQFAIHRKALKVGNLEQIHSELTRLTRLYPLHLPAILFEQPAEQLVVFESLHQQHCAACHDVPATNTERPAHNLSVSVSSMPEDEFFARMLTGVRGDRITGIDNPLSDYELVGLIRYYTRFKD